MSDTGRKQQNKNIAQMVLAIMRRTKPETRLGHAYEALARAHGFRDWNTAAAEDIEFDSDIVQRLELLWPHDVGNL